ncbi:MAG TPA: PilZ domain-containing protein [Verrucomicrobiae bacterium]|nr:PilZ domain-containing protein [Verrucomicrobiae bacterium]
MSARKIGSIGSLNQKFTVTARQAHLELSADTVAIHKNGIEFRSPTPFNEWAEMTVALLSPRDGSKLHCSGVVVACSGSKHTGYRISMIFTNVSKQAQTRLATMARSDLGA